jgi:hypothetical protein
LALERKRLVRLVADLVQCVRAEGIGSRMKISKLLGREMLWEQVSDEAKKGSGTD